MARKKSPHKGNKRKHAARGARLAYDATRQEKRKSKRKSRRRKSSRLQKVHRAFMKKELRKLNHKG